MNPLAHDWPIKHRAAACAVTNRPFETGEQFYTLLFREGTGYRREDLSEEAWANRNENIRPFSFWKTRYEPPPPAPPETLAKESAEELLRRLLAENRQPNACYVLAAMLERKRILKPIQKESADSGPVLIYEHAKTGDVFIVPDVHLRLDELESVQTEVASLLKAAEGA
jgi:hypothetical protein